MVDAEWDRRALIAGTVAAIAIARGVELAISARNLRRVRENGTPHAASTSSAEYAVMVVVHVLFLACPLLALRTKEQLGSNELALAALFALALAACLRWWTMWTLGPRWNARAVVAPSLGAVHGGPFRYFRHPNYLAVTIEFAALPLVAGTWRSGALLFVINTMLLARRVRAEERLLAQIPGWREGFGR